MALTLEKAMTTDKVEGDSLGPTLSNEGEVADLPASDNRDGLVRRFSNRQLQIIAIGGSIGTGTFISVGTGLSEGGPASLFLAFFIYACVIVLVNNSMAEMMVYMPVSGGFVRVAGQWADDAFGFMAGWNFFFYEGFLIPFEITALNVVISFWSDKVPAEAVCLGCIFLYGLINLGAVKFFGEAEFWLSGGKIILLFLLFGFTFVTMVGGNPQHDAYGFRHWNSPGPFAEYLSGGSLGRFEGFLACVWNGAFMIVGPELLSMTAAEAKFPRTYLKKAYNSVYWRLGAFFVGTALCVGIVCAHNDPELIKSSGSGSASSSPYVIAMKNMNISVLPHIVNALLITSIFSAGNNLVFCCTRTLYALSLQGRAPKFFQKTTKTGVPFRAFCLTMIFPLLSLLTLSSGSAKVLEWLINIITAGGLINFIVISITYIRFYGACKAQNFPRENLPYTGWLQPYCAYFALAFETAVVFVYGYTSLSPFDIAGFFTHYTMVIVCPVLFVVWKVIHKTKWLKPEELDLVWESPYVNAYEANLEEPITTFWGEMLDLVRFWKSSKAEDKES